MLPREMGNSLYWAPEQKHFVLIRPTFDPAPYKFARYGLRLKRYYSQDEYAALRLVLENKVSFTSDGALERLKHLKGMVDRSYAVLPSPGLWTDIPCPAGKAYLPYQIAGIQAAMAILQGARMDTRKAALLADEMGLGKTIQAIGVCLALRVKRVLVLCPASLRINWEREIHAWAGDVEISHVTSSWRTNKGLAGEKRIVTPWTIASYDMAWRNVERLMDDVFDIIIADEAHYLKGIKSSRTLAVIGKQGGFDGLITRAPRTIFLTGTPVPNRPIEAWSFVWPFLLDRFPHTPSKNRWERFYGSWYQGRYGMQYAGGKNLDDLNMRLRTGFMIRRMKKDVLHDLPAKRHKLVVLPLSGLEVRNIVKEEKGFDVDEIIRHGNPVGSPLAKLRREMGIAKLPFIIDYLKDLMEEVEKVVVFCWHVEVVEGIKAAFPNAVSITGSTPLKARQEAADAFQLGDAPMIIGNIQAMGVGWTFTASSNVVMAEHSYVPGDNIQAADRCHRIGQRGSVTIHDLVIEGSLDGKVLLAAARKVDEIEDILS